MPPKPIKLNDWRFLPHKDTRGETPPQSCDRTSIFVVPCDDENEEDVNRRQLLKARLRLRGAAILPDLKSLLSSVYDNLIVVEHSAVVRPLADRAPISRRKSIRYTTEREIQIIYLLADTRFDNFLQSGSVFYPAVSFCAEPSLWKKWERELLLLRGRTGLTTAMERVDVGGSELSSVSNHSSSLISLNTSQGDSGSKRKASSSYNSSNSTASIKRSCRSETGTYEQTDSLAESDQDPPSPTSSDREACEVSVVCPSERSTVVGIMSPRAYRDLSPSITERIRRDRNQLDYTSSPEMSTAAEDTREERWRQPYPRLDRSWILDSLPNGE